MGPWTSGPAHVYWTKPGSSLGQVRHILIKYEYFIALFWKMTFFQNLRKKIIGPYPLLYFADYLLDICRNATTFDVE